MKTWTYNQDRQSWLFYLFNDTATATILWIVTMAGLAWVGWWYDGYRMERAARIMRENGIGVAAPVVK